MPKPLNQQLYNLLQRNLPGGVLIHAAGEAFCGVYFPSPLTDKPTLLVQRRGETYIGNCPFCGDTRGRLHVNHRWNVVDDQGNDNLHLVYCFNEGCLNTRDKQVQFREMIWQLGRRGSREQLRTVRVKETEYDPNPPGDITYLSELDPQHHAVQYLQERGFDPAQLSKLYGVGYCEHSHKQLARDRIYIPMLMDGKLLGWQMRYIGTPEGKWPPKYYSCPGQPGRRMLYNFDRAKKYKTVIMVEGPSDVWGAGPQSFGLIGKKLSDKKCDRIKRLPKDTTLVIMLDPDQSPKEQAKGLKHQIEEAYDLLRGSFKGRIVKCYLPPGTDPGSLDRDVIYDYIRLAAEDQGVPVQLGLDARRKKAKK